MELNSFLLEHLLENPESGVFLAPERGPIQSVNAVAKRLESDFGASPMQDFVRDLRSLLSSHEFPVRRTLDQRNCPSLTQLSGLGSVELLGELGPICVSPDSKLPVQIVLVSRSLSYCDLVSEHAKLKVIVDSIDIGLTIHLLDVGTGKSTTVSMNQAYTDLTGVTFEQAAVFGIAATGVRCHPEDLRISDLIAEHSIKQMRTLKWPIRIFANGQYRWCEYAIFNKSFDGKTIVMTGYIRDFSREADHMGLQDSPGVKEIVSSITGEVRLVPVPTRHESYNEGDDADGGDPTNDGGRSDTGSLISATTLASLDMSQEYIRSLRSESLRCPITLLVKRKVLLYLSNLLKGEREWSPWDGAGISFAIEDLDAITEETILLLPSIQQSEFRAAVDACDVRACARLLSDTLGASRKDWFDASDQEISFSVRSPFLPCTMYMLMRVSQEGMNAETIACMQRVDELVRGSIVTGGETGSCAIRLALALTVLRVALHRPDLFASNPARVWLPSVVSQALAGGSEVCMVDPILGSTMFWMSMQWAVYHVITGKESIGVDILDSCVDDMQQFLEMYPESAIVRKLIHVAEEYIRKLDGSDERNSQDSQSSA